MAFARKLPFAKRWAKQTDFAALPERKDAGTVAGTPLSGPGGLLGTPGMGKPRKGRKWGKKHKSSYPDQTQFAGYTMEDWDDTKPDSFYHDTRPRKWGNPKKLKDCTCGVNVATKEQIAPGITRIRGNLCNVHGRYGPCDASQSGKKPKGKRLSKGRKPAKAKKPVLTPEQRAQAREQAQAQNRGKVLAGLGIAPDGQAALEALRSGKQADAGALARGGFEKAGLVERAQDGSYRLSASGRAMLGAASQGDTGRAGGTISAARDRTSARTQRQAAAADRKQAADERRKKAAAARAKKQSSSGGKQASSGGGKQASDHMQRQAEHEADRKQKLQEHAEDRTRRLTEHEQDRARREAERQQQAGGKQPPAPRQAPTSRVDTSRPGVIGQRRKRIGGAGMAHGRANVGTIAGKSMLTNPTFETDWTWAGKAGNPGDYLIVEDRTKPTTWHLQVKKGGTPDHGLMGSAWAALHSGFRGNVYSGPNKGGAIAKLRALYKREKMPIPEGKSYSEPLRAIDSSKSQKSLQSGALRFTTAPGGESPGEHGLTTDPHPASSIPLFSVFKSANGDYRWIARSTTAYRDRDKEILPIATLDADSQRMTDAQQFGPLRWWHLGNPDPFNADNPAGPGVDLGDCDFSMQIGTARVESGTFKSAAVAQKIADTADEYELSPGFFHPIDQPQDGVYTAMRTFERSLVPVKFGRASNLFTGLTVKEFAMDATEQARRFNAAVDQLGLTPEQAQSLAAGLTKTDKSAALAVDPATGKIGVAYKTDEDDPWATAFAAFKNAMMGMAPPVAEKAPMAPASEAQMGATEMADAAAQQADDGGDGTEDEAAEEADYIGDMSVADFEQMLMQTFQQAIQQFGSAITTHMGALDEAVKGMGYARTKAESEVTALKADQEKIAARLAELEGDQPAVSLKDVSEALNGKPQTPEVQPQTDPSNPFSGWARQTWPELFGANNS